ncbi:MAG: hypothetical protein J5I90_20245 [Caldilineales bacterium]|nr:hypothetical protein [Caldilineales bacterium]
MNGENMLQERDWMEALAREAGEIGMRHFRRTVSSRKADNTIVTAADREIEAFLVAEIRRGFPEDSILGEEGASNQGSSDRTWVLDPIDGTAVFSFGLPPWCVCIGLMAGARPVAGVVYLPASDDCFICGEEGPALLNGQPIALAPFAPYDKETILFGVADAHRDWDIDFPGKVRSFGSCAAHICYVASGSGVGGVNTHTALWDMAASLAILERAGGQCTLLDGSPLPVAQLFDGSKAPQPILFAPPYFLDDIRGRLRYHPA